MSRWGFALLMGLITGVLYLQLPTTFAVRHMPALCRACICTAPVLIQHIMQPSSNRRVQGGLSIMGLLNRSVDFLYLLTASRLEATHSYNGILLRQHSDLMYPVWVEWLPGVLLSLPVLAMDVVAYGTPLYWLVGISPSPKAFAVFLLLLFSFSVASNSMFWVYGSACRSLHVAVGICVCHSLINGMLGGFVVTPGSIPAAWHVIALTCVHKC